MKQPDIGIQKKDRDAISSLLSVVLANAHVLYIKTRKFHWNVSGESFMELHKLFEAQYKKIEEAIDEIAERINKLGSKTPGTMSEFIKTSTLKEAPGKYPTREQMIADLMADHESVIRDLRKNIDQAEEKYKDKGTADFLTDLVREHETIAWTLRRYLD